MLAVSKRRRNLTVSIFTSIAILALLLYYILEHIPNNERRINTRNFRVLARIGVNLNATVKSYNEHVLRNYAHFTFSKLPETNPETLNDTLNKGNKVVIPSRGNGTQQDLSSVLLAMDRKKELVSRFRLEYDPIKTEILEPLRLEGKYFHFQSYVAVETLDGTRKWMEPKDSLYLFQAKLSIDSLLPSLHRKDIFEHLLVLQTETVQENNGEKIKGKILYNSSSFYPNLIQIDSLVNTRQGLFGGKVVEVELAGVPYKLYLLGQDVGLKDKWILAGAVPVNQIRAEQMAIDSSLVIFILLALAILVLALPFIKLMLMNKQERLQKRDVLLSAFSLFAGVSLTVLLLFDSYSYLGPDSATKQKQLEGLGDGVANQLNAEIKQATEQLSELDSLKIEKNNIVNLNSDDVKWEETDKTAPDPLLDSLRKLTKYPNMIRVFWANRRGEKLCTWTTRSENNENNSVANRDYFSTISQGKGWVLNGMQEQFYLQSILSWNDGEKYAIISKESRSDSAKVIALTTKLSSLSNSSVPPGYGFFLINQQGEVLFHKDEDLSLNENLLEESDYNQNLQAALFGYIPTYFEEHYQGSTHQFFIQPLPDLPLFIVTYANRDYQSASKVHIISLATSLLLFYFFFLVIQLGLPIMVTMRPTKLKFHRLSFRWLWPQRHEQRIVAYWRVTLALLFTIGVIMVLTDRDRPVASFFIMLLAINYTFAFAYISIRNLTWKNLFRDDSKYVLGVSVGSTFLLNLICWFLYEDYKWVLWFQMILGVGFTVISSLQLLPIRLPREYQQAYILMVLSWLFLTSVMPSFFVFRIAYDYEAELMVRHHQLHLAHDISQKRHQQKVYQEKQELNKPDESTIKGGNSIYTEFFHYTKEIPDTLSMVKHPAPKNLNHPSKMVSLGSVTSIGAQQRSAETVQTFPTGFGNPKERLLLNFIYFVRPVFNNVLANEVYLIREPSSRATWSILDRSNYLLKMVYTNYADPDCSVSLSSQLPLYQLPGFAFTGENAEKAMLSGGFFWLEALLLLGFLFLLVSFLINRVFNLNLLHNLKMGQIDQELLDYRVENKVLLISMPGTPEMSFINPGSLLAGPGKTPVQKKSIFAFINQLAFSWKKTEKTTVSSNRPVRVKEIDLARFEIKALMSHLNIRQEDMVVLVKNFDHEPYEERWIQQKIELLQYLDSLQGKKIILYSSEHPSKWEEKIKESMFPSEDLEVAARKEAILKQVRLLLHNLNKFTKVYLPLQGMLAINENIEIYNRNLAKTTVKPKNKPSNELNQRRKYLLQVVKAECLSCNHLAQYQKCLQDYVWAHFEEKRLTRSDIILKIQSLAQLYYRELWSKCSEGEHYMLYDLAQDGLVNARNVGVLSSLLSKGLLIREKKLTLRIFNESFRNFVLSVVNKEEALRFENDTAKGSRWETYRTPLFMVLTGAMLFIFYTQKDTWTMMLTVLTALSTMVGILPRLGLLIPAFLAKGEAK